MGWSIEEAQFGNANTGKWDSGTGTNAMYTAYSKKLDKLTP
jgi:hypothetical protein